MVENLRLEKKWVENYLNDLEQSTVSSVCPVVLPPVSTGSNVTAIENITNYINYTNIDADNWVYGDISDVDYLKQLFEFITTHNVTKCPL